MKNNIAPFYVGQKVVCLVTKYNFFGVGVLKDKVYTVESIHKCSCGCYNINVGLPVNHLGHSDCVSCGKIISDKRAWCPSRFFAPLLEQSAPLLTFEKIKESETKKESQEQEILIPN